MPIGTAVRPSLKAFIMSIPRTNTEPNGLTFKAEYFDTCPAEWNRIIAPLAGASILQTAEWGEIKGSRG